MQPNDFIAMIATDARKLQKSDKVFASVTIAQACLETGFGAFQPVDKYTRKESYNLFGVKGTGTVGSVTCNTWEVVNGKRITIEAKFRAYNNYYESLKDHGKVLQLSRYSPVRNARDGESAARQLQPCGYATDPDYGNKLVSIQKKYNLYQYDAPLEKLYAVYQGKNHISDYYDFNSAVTEAVELSNSYVTKISDGSWVWSNIKKEEESEDDSPMKLEAWQKTMLISGIKGFSKLNGVDGKPLINSPDDWIKKVEKETLTAGELATINFAILTRKVN